MAKDETVDKYMFYFRHGTPTEFKDLLIKNGLEFVTYSSHFTVDGAAYARDVFTRCALSGRITPLEGSAYIKIPINKDVVLDKGNVKYYEGLMSSGDAIHESFFRDAISQASYQLEEQVTSD